MEEGNKDVGIPPSTSKAENDFRLNGESQKSVNTLIEGHNLKETNFLELVKGKEPTVNYLCLGKISTWDFTPSLLNSLFYIFILMSWFFFFLFSLRSLLLWSCLGLESRLRL